jgi:iron complex outermembrane receptor protein
LPESRWNLTAVHNTGDWSLMARYNWVDEWIWWDIYADPVFSETVDDMFTLDLEVRRDLGAYTLTLGAQNVTDEVPDNPASTLCCGMKYPEGSPLGFNGAFYYFKVGLDF